MTRLKNFCLFAITLASITWCDAVNPNEAPPKEEPWSLHFQATVVSQYHSGFTSPYSGMNSLSSDPEWNTSLTSTLYLGARLWQGAQAYFDPELEGGSGFSRTRGLAGFPNGEIYRVDSPSPKAGLARLYLQQSFGLGQALEYVGPDENQLAGNVDAARITVTAGKFSLNDFLDDNRYSHDPRTQFLNWTLMDYGAWDYAADTKGYTWGAVVEFIRPGWALRLASVMEPREANGLDMDPNVFHAHGDNLEVEKSYFMALHPGKVRFLAYANHADMGNYGEVLNSTVDSMEISKTRSYSVKYGIGLNVEQEITADLGLFARASWNDGHTETWAFTEIDRSLSAGMDLTGSVWKRPADHLGAAVILNGLSREHEDYLAAGGYGFIIGDGKLDYAPEELMEMYYLCSPRRFIGVSLDYQEAVNPAYNRDRGPVAIFAGRLHLEF